MNSSKNTIARAFAPGHLTGLFRIFEFEDGTRGSTGAGLNTELGVHTQVRFIDGTEDSIFINGSLSEAPVSRLVLSKFLEPLAGRVVEIKHLIEYPVGYGLGMSGAGALSLSLALNELLEGVFPKSRCVEIARDADIESGCGLGDVLAQQFHGIMMGLPPYPSVTAKVLDDSDWYLTCAFFDSLETSSIINEPSWKIKIDEAGEKAMAALSSDFSPESFIREARAFTKATGLAGDSVLAVMQAVPTASMAMLGQTAYVLTRTAEEGLEKLSSFSDRVLCSKVAKQAARVISE